MGWRIVTYRLGPEQSSRHRVAIWRELRRVGAVSLQQATWAVPSGEACDAGLERARELVERAGGHARVFDVIVSEHVAGELEALHGAEREEEWREFCSECDKAEAELRGEIEKEKFTLAELDEEEQNIDRLRRWYRDLRAKDLFGAPSAMDAELRLKKCADLLEEFAIRVYDVRERP